MTQFSPEYFNLSGDLLEQCAQTDGDNLSSVLTQDNLDNKRDSQ